MVSELEVENLKDLVREALPPDKVQLVDVKELTKEATDLEVARLIVQQAIAGEIRADTNLEFYKDIYRSVGKMAQDYCHAMFVKGKPGIGKSYHIKRALLQYKLPYTEITGQVTEAYLYRLLYENNGKVLWFNDVNSLLSGIGSVNLLKASTEVGRERILTLSSYSHAQDGLPKNFKFTGKVIFDYNELHGDLKGDFDALVSRGDYIGLSFQPEELSEILKNVAKNDWEMETTEFVIQHTAPEALNLRVQQKAFLTRKYAGKGGLDWKEEVKAELAKYKSREFYELYDMIGKAPIGTVALKKKFMHSGKAKSLRTADRLVSELMFKGVLRKADDAKRDFKVQLNWGD